MVKWDPEEFVARAIGPVTIDGTIRVAKIVERAKRYRVQIPGPIDLEFTGWPYPIARLQASHLEVKATVRSTDGEDRVAGVEFSIRFPLAEMEDPDELRAAILHCAARALLHALHANLLDEDGSSEWLRHRASLHGGAA